MTRMKIARVSVWARTESIALRKACERGARTYMFTAHDYNKWDDIEETIGNTCSRLPGFSSFSIISKETIEVMNII